MSWFANRHFVLVWGWLFWFGIAGVVGCRSSRSDDSERGRVARGSSSPEQLLPLQVLLDTFSDHQATARDALDAIDQNWRGEYLAPLVVAYRMGRNERRKEEILDLLQRRMGLDRRERPDWRDLYRQVWQDPSPLHPDYGEFLAAIHERTDPSFRRYFEGNPTALINLEEVVWGGVRRDGIPPLVDPKMIPADQAHWLADTDVVFGVSLNGDSRCYPKRILAHHEMFKATVGGVPVCGVYCTLCGTLIVYDTRVDGRRYDLGTSGFLYRSNKLMYDQATRSLWSTLEGKPVVGNLVDQGIELQPLACVTTTWGEWRKEHPESAVLSLDTGFDRDYGEGVAYAAYFATDELMFYVPRTDDRLKNKDEVLAVRLADQADLPLAIDVRFLKSHPVYHHQSGDVSIVVLTDASGACRVYRSGDVQFARLEPAAEGGLPVAIDDEGNRWSMTESALVREDRKLERIAAHRVFWFGWYAQFPNTELVR